MAASALESRTRQVRKASKCAAARGHSVLARQQDHASDPRADRANAVHDGALEKRFEGRAQRLEQAVKKHSGDVVGDYENSPGEHGRIEHLQRTIEETENRDEHDREEKSVGGGIAFEGAIIEPGQAIRGDQGAAHYDCQRCAGVEADADRGTYCFC